MSPLRIRDITAKGFSIVRHKGRRRQENAGTGAVTQADVARLAKVSTGTVSRVINSQALVSEKAKRKVQDAIKKLGYLPNKAAQALVNGETKGILLLCIDKGPIMPSTWQYELPVLQGIEGYLKQLGYTLDICMPTYEEVANPGFIDRLLWNRIFDGILILTAWVLDISFIKDLKARNIPTICIGNGPYREKGVNLCGCTVFDNYSVIKEIYSTLFDLGHRRIAFIKGSEHHLHAIQRFKGYRQALREHEIAIDSRYEFQGSYDVLSGCSAMENFLSISEPPTAVIAANDLMAIGVMRTAIRRGLSVPKDISVVGFDDIQVSEFMEPSLSSVRVPSRDLGTKSAESLYRCIQKRSTGCSTTTLRVNFIKRDSVGSRRA
jgi:LacI family transcriptional regulator